MMDVHLLISMAGALPAQTQIRAMPPGHIVDMETHMVVNVTTHSTTVDSTITAVSVHLGVLQVSTETMITTHGNTVMMTI